MTISNKNSKIEKLYETLRQDGQALATPITWGRLKEFMRNITDPAATFVKALQFYSGNRPPDVYDVYNQFAWDQAGNQVDIAVVSPEVRV